MANIPNTRQGNTVLAHIKLTDGGVAVTWAGFSDIRVDAYSVEQKMLAARCSVERNPQDDTLLDMVYSGDAPQYLGICKIIVRGTYENRKKTYDAPLVNFVAATAQATGVIVIDDPEVNVYIEAQDVSTSVIDEAVAAALAAADHAEEAAVTANTAAANADAAREAIQTDLAGKVDKVPGKGLSTNDYTNEDKSKLAGIAAGAQVNVIETVKVNGTALAPDANKAVDVPVPTQLSQLDGDVDHRTVSDAEKSTWNGKQDAINDLATIRSRADEGHTAYGWKGNPGGTAELDENGKVLSAQLPSYVDDVLEYPTMSDFPATGESGKIYIAIDTNLSYRWSGSGYSEISPSLALGETASTAYRGDRGKVAYDHATDSDRLTTAKNSGLYKIGVTEQGHVSGAIPVEKTDITDLGIAATEDIPTVPTISTDIDADKASNTKTASPKAVYDHVPNLAVNAKTEAKTDQEIVFRKTNVSWPAKAALLKKLKGKTLAWNQLVVNGNFANGATGWLFDGTGSVSDGIATVSGVSSYIGLYQSTIYPIQNHVYYYHADVCSSESVSFRAYFGSGTIYVLISTTLTANEWTKVSSVSLCNIQPANYIQQGIYSSGTLQIKNIICIDLTLMFGSGNEPTTVADFEAMFPLPYYAYNAGTLISNDAEALETVGFNQWDEEWELYAPYTNAIISKNFCRCLPNTAYFLKCANYTNNYYLAILFYDANYEQIDVQFACNATAISPNNAVWFKIVTNTSTYIYGGTYNHDICINLSDPARNGQYEPYKKSVLPLNLNSFKVTDGTNEYTINGLKSCPGALALSGAAVIGAAYDSIDLIRKKYIKRIETIVYDGTENWTKEAGGTIFVLKNWYTGHPTPYMRPYDSQGQGGVGLCSILGQSRLTSGAVGSTFSLITGDPSWGFDILHNAIPNGENMDATQFKSWLASLYAAGTPLVLNYVIATPEEYDLVDPLLQEYTCDKDGTEQAVPPTSATNPSAPLCCDLQYGISSGDTAGELGKLYDLIFALQARVEELENS